MTDLSSLKFGVGVIVPPSSFFPSRPTSFGCFFANRVIAVWRIAVMGVVSLVFGLSCLGFCFGSPKDRGARAAFAAVCVFHAIRQFFYTQDNEELECKMQDGRLIQTQELRGYTKRFFEPLTVGDVRNETFNSLFAIKVAAGRIFGITFKFE